MSLRLYLFIMSAMTALCAAVFAYVIWTVDPAQTNGVGFALFYLSLFFFLSGAAALIGFLIRFVFLRHVLAVNKVMVAFRQAFLFAGFAVITLILQSRGLLTWLNLIILIIGLSALEFFLLSYGRSKIVESENIKMENDN